VTSVYGNFRTKFHYEICGLWFNSNEEMWTQWWIKYRAIYSLDYCDIKFPGHLIIHIAQWVFFLPVKIHVFIFNICKERNLSSISSQGNLICKPYRGLIKWEKVFVTARICCHIISCDIFRRGNIPAVKTVSESRAGVVCSSKIIGTRTPGYCCNI